MANLGLFRLVTRTVLAVALAVPLTVRAQEGLSPQVTDLMSRAANGDPAAQFGLGNAYDGGLGVPRDGQKAMHWYLLSAEQGHAEAQNSVGSGFQAERRFAEALPWYERAAAQHHALATNNLAYLHDLGLGVPQDRQRAFKLYSQAADLGWAPAMWNMANMYGAGQVGAQPDLFEACVWTLRAGQHASVAERQLHGQVRKVTSMLERRLSSEQLITCRQLAKSWVPPEIDRRSDRPSRSP